MELRAFAEQVLFATSLEGKLRRPGTITDEHPGPPLLTPPAPGRPATLQFKPHGSGKSEFPGLHRLEQLPERGRLLHFFANHELLATELMALVLLKFPDAPPAFRKGVLLTLQDEQEHTRLYLERIRACGLELGDLPVSGYFWRCVAPMEHPIDYVAGLCLTFEQANLDFARHYARAFAQVGDAPAAALLEKIHRDEIGHVAYGLKWFRRWKQPDETDWAAFCRTLRFPLSPQRAKGFQLNVAARRAAGLDEHFIAELDVYSQSKGRTPGVFVFNPFAEGRIAEGKGFNPTRHQRQLAADLENLPQFLCRQDDIVLVSARPAVGFLSAIKQAGFPLPEFVIRPGATELDGRKLGALRPWAWSPDSVELLQPLFAQLTHSRCPPGHYFNAHRAELYGKDWSASFLRSFLAEAASAQSGEDRAWLCEPAEVGVTANSLEAALAAIAAIRARGQHRVVAKEAVGLAGSNALRLFEPELRESQRRWLARATTGGRGLVIEPWLERLQDFSLQLEMTPDGLKLCGYTGLLNDAKGQYRGNWAESHYHTRIPSRIVALFPGVPDIARRMLRLYAEIFGALAAELQQRDFLGPVGMDAFVYRDATGQPRLKPIVEINPRYTMGRVLVELMARTAQGRSGGLRLLNRADLRVTGHESLASYAEATCRQFPLRLEGEPVPRISEGVVFLNDATRVTAVLAEFRVGRELDSILPAPPRTGVRDESPPASASP